MKDNKTGLDIEEPAALDKAVREHVGLALAGLAATALLEPGR